VTRTKGALYALALLAAVLFRPVIEFVDQAVLGHSPLNPKE
jgi:hypothetical protein